jgi:hypothetical protein
MGRLDLPSDLPITFPVTTEKRFSKTNSQFFPHALLLAQVYSFSSLARSVLIAQSFLLLVLQNRDLLCERYLQLHVCLIS